MQQQDFNIEVKSRLSPETRMRQSAVQAVPLQLQIGLGNSFDTGRIALRSAHAALSTGT